MVKTLTHNLSDILCDIDSIIQKTNIIFNKHKLQSNAIAKCILNDRRMTIDR